MSETIITIYCFFDELLKAVGLQDHPHAELTNAEIMTIATVAAEMFTGNQQKALDFMISHGYVKRFSKSRFNRRLHRIPDSVWQFALHVMAQVHQEANKDKFHVVDTYPLPVCRNIRIWRCRIYSDRQLFRGYCASKKEYYFGLKVCVVVTEDGHPVELLLAPASTGDIVALRSMDLDLPHESTVFGDTGFLDRDFEVSLRDDAAVRLVVPRRSNMKEQLDGCLQYICNHYRKRVETTFSLLAERTARSIHAVTAKGFELKAFLTVLAYSITM